MLIKDSIIKFFKQKMDVDITNVSIVTTQLPGTDTGEYSRGVHNTIVVDVDKIRLAYGSSSDIIIDTCIVHELVHLCQMQYNKSLMLPINSVFSGRLLSNRFYDFPDYQQPVEIDALIMECYYLYCSGDFKHDGIKDYAKHTALANVENVLEYAKRLKDGHFCALMPSNKKSNKSNNSNKKEC